MHRTCQFYIIMTALLTIIVSGCSALSPQKDRMDLSGHEKYARKCYELGISYMEESRYELARQQFSFAAAGAVSKKLYLKAAEGVNRVDRIIKQKR